MFKQEIISLLSKAAKLKEKEIETLLETPPDTKLGDYAFPCFSLSKKLKKSPVEICRELSKKIKPALNIEKIQQSGPYLNFFFNQKKLAEKVIGINANFGKTNLGKKKKIVIDFSGPNIGKPMHVGHIRSTIIGDSMMRIYDYLGYNPIGINYLGDVGLHIGKLIVAYELWRDEKALKKDPVKELLRLYVKFCENEETKIKEGIEEEFQDNEWTNKAKEKIKLIELGDTKTKKIWDEIRSHSGKGFDKIYSMLNVRFHHTVGQSEFTDKGKGLVISALKKGIAHREEDGAIYVEIKGIKKYVLRANETASYITYDLGAAVERHKLYKFHKSIYITDFRQSDHFTGLFEMLRLLGYDFADRMVHMPFGTVRFGKEIMATRKGKVILLDDVLQKTIKKAESEIKKRKTKGSPEKVGVGAIKYLILKNEPMSDVQFSWEQALDFQGNTGPYLQYSYARASSIIKKAKNFNKSKTEFELTDCESNLIKKIAKFPKIVVDAGERMNPAFIATYAFELSKLFNEFYQNCKVIGDRNEAFRLKLIDSFRTTLHNALHLLGIEVMDEM
jgi:arginyl-tRNA synthetase